MQKLKAALTSEMATIVWRGVIILMLSGAGWMLERQIERIDRHDTKIQEIQLLVSNSFVRKAELCDLKNDVKTIKSSLDQELPEIKFFMGQVTEYMRGGRSR